MLADGKVLLIATGDGSRWQLPKGRIEAGESPRQAAVREIQEETGILCQIRGELGEVHYSFTTRSGRTIQKRVTHFLCSYLRGSVKDCDLNEVHEAAWVPWAAALDRLTFENERELVRLALQRNRAGAVSTPGETDGPDAIS